MNFYEAAGGVSRRPRLRDLAGSGQSAIRFWTQDAAVIAGAQRWAS